MSSYTGGLLIAADAGLPPSCSAATSGWMLIPKADEPMIATFLSHWMAARREACIYATLPSPGAYCTINQYDPSE